VAETNQIQLKVGRADKHIGELQTVLRAFIDSRPYVVGTKRDPQTRRLIYYIARAEPIPVEVALIAGDVLQNLRTALDYLVCALVRAKGESDRMSAFPITDEEPVSKEQKARFDARIEGMGDEAKEIIRRIRPYKGGDDILWSLHALNNRDKHRLLFTVGAALHAFDIGTYLTRPFLAKMAETSGHPPPSLEMPLWLKPKDRMFPLKAGDELFTDLPDAKPSKDIKFAFDIALDEPGIVAGESLIAIVRARHQRVMRVVEMFAGLY
jgi:hypothetical protein